MRTSKRSRVVLAAASTLALAGAGAGVATATSTSTSKPAANSARPAPPAELTGTALTQASAAAIAAVPGGTVEHANAAGKMDPSGTAYDIHVTKTDGTHVVVLEDTTFKVLSVKADHGPGGPGGRGGPGGPGGRGGPGGGAALTGTTLTQASAAAIAAVPGGTVEHASAAGPNAASGAAYDVLVGKTDGTRVVVLEDSTFKVLSVKTPPTPPQGAGKPPAMPANSTP